MNAFRLNESKPKIRTLKGGKSVENAFDLRTVSRIPPTKPNHLRTNKLNT